MYSLATFLLVSCVSASSFQQSSYYSSSSCTGEPNTFLVNYASNGCSLPFAGCFKNSSFACVSSVNTAPPGTTSTYVISAMYSLNSNCQASSLLSGAGYIATGSCITESTYSSYKATCVNGQPMLKRYSDASCNYPSTVSNGTTCNSGTNFMTQLSCSGSGSPSNGAGLGGVTSATYSQIAFASGSCGSAPQYFVNTLNACSVNGLSFCAPYSAAQSQVYSAANCVANGFSLPSGSSGTYVMSSVYQNSDCSGDAVSVTGMLADGTCKTTTNGDSFIASIQSNGVPLVTLFSDSNCQNQTGISNTKDCSSGSQLSMLTSSALSVLLNIHQSLVLTLVAFFALISLS